MLLRSDSSELFKKHRDRGEHGGGEKNPTHTWCGLVHVELAGYQNLQGLNQRIQTGLSSEQGENQHSETEQEYIQSAASNFITALVVFS